MIGFVGAFFEVIGEGLQGLIGGLFVGEASFLLGFAVGGSGFVWAAARHGWVPFGCMRVSRLGSG